MSYSKRRCNKNLTQQSQIIQKMQIHNFTIIFSLASLGFFGGFTHCSGMCGPFVLTQVSNRLQNIPLNKFSNFEKLRNLALMPYHLGRITTYAFIGFFCSLIATNIKNLDQFNHLAGLMLLIAATIFLRNFYQSFYPKFLSKNLSQLKKFSFLPNLPKIKTPLFLKNLFNNPRGLNGYFLGIILGFIPCGLLYGAFALAAAINNPIFAALAMFIFGITTFPALFLTASGGYIFLKLTSANFKIISKIIILINIITLAVMGVGLIIN